jgi:TP901 family phage tail tape measure protein
MADVNANIGVNIDTSAALANLKNLQRQISVFHSSMAKSGAAASAVSAGMQQNLINTINQTGKFSASMRNVKSTTESFTNALEKNKLSMREYFRYSAASTKTFGRMFRTEFDTIDKVARERVKTLQTQYIKMGRDANGAMKAIAVRPLALDMQNLATQTQMAAQKQALFNQLVKQGSTNLLNFGKNTQWAGRQLMVGFTVPLTMLGVVAGRTFMQLEEQAIRFRRVYGETFTASSETDKMLEQVKGLAKEFTKYGVAVEKTMEMAATAAASGKMGADLLAQVNEATRLAILGGVEQEQALETTISLTNTFGIAAEELAKKINFLNAVENQTVVSIEDLTIAIPKAGPVVQQLGGNVEDLAFFLTAMKEGGINASEGANALKSGLAALINPTGKAAEMLKSFGINVQGIVESNKGDVKGLVLDFASALDTLDPLSRARAIEQLFGKFQFSRLSTLFKNVISEGNQASRVLKLTKATTEELAILSERELGNIENTTTYKFKKALEDLKSSLAPVGEEFLKALTPIIEIGTKILNAFNDLDSGAKTFVVNLVGIAGLIGPAFLMAFGLIANGFANLIKMFAFIGRGFAATKSSTTDLAAQTQYMTNEQLEAAAVGASLNQTHMRLTQTFTSEVAAVNALTAAYNRSVAAQGRFSGATVGRARPPKKYASGVLSVPGPKGAGDVVPAMLSPGEAVIPAKQAEKYSGFISSMISGNVPGFRFGLNPFASMLGRSRVGTRMSGANFSQALASGNPKYQSGFVTGTGDDFLTKYGMPKTKQSGLRTNAEQAFFGLPSGTNPQNRPSYGFAATSPLQAILNRILFGKAGSRMSGAMNPLSKSLDRYGDVSLIGKKGLSKRSSAYAGDVLLDYSRAPGGRNKMFPFAPAPMRGATGSQLDAARFGSFGQSFGDRQTGANQFTTNRKPPYIETYTPGGFGFNEIEKIVTRDKTLAAQLQSELKAAGLGSIKVKSPGFIEKLLSKIGFAGYANGVFSVPGPKGAGDVVPAMLSPGEAVIPAKQAEKYGTLIRGMVSGSIPGFENSNIKGYTNATMFLSEADNEALRAGKADPKTLASSIRSGGAMGASPFVTEIMRSMGFSSQSQIKKALQNPEIKKQMSSFATSFSTTLASQVAASKTPMTDAKFSEISGKVAREEAAKRGAIFAKATEQVLTRPTTFENRSVERINKAGKARAMGRSQIFSGVPSYRNKRADYMATGSALGLSGTMPANAVMAHITEPIKTSLSKLAASGPLTSIAQGARKLMEAGQKIVYREGTPSRKISVPATSTAKESIAKLEDKTVKANAKTVKEEKQVVKEKAKTVKEDSKVTKVKATTAKVEKENIVNAKQAQTTQAKSDAARKGWETRRSNLVNKSADPMGAKRGVGGKIAAGAGAAGVVGVMGASMIPGQIGEMAQQLMMPVMLLSMIAPMLKNPVAIALVAVGALAGAIVLLGMKLKDATKSGLDAGKAMSMTNEKLDQMSEFTGAVTASQLAERKRATQLTGEGAKKRQFGQNYLESEAGKSLLSDAERMIGSGMSSSEVASNFATQLSYAVMQGAVTEEQAKSIANGLAEKLGNYSIGLNITGQLKELFGSNGENLLKGDPLQISLAIQEKSAAQQIASYQNALTIANENAQNDAFNNSILGKLLVIPQLSEIGDLEENKKAQGIAVQLGSEQLAQNQGLVDSLEMQYNNQIAALEAEKENAKTKKDRLAVEQKITEKIAERDAGLKSQKEANAEIFNSLIKQSKILGSGFTDSINLAIDEKFKNATGGLKAAAEMAKTSLSALQAGDFKATLQIGLASGEFDPITISTLINANKESGGAIERSFKIMVDAVGTADANQAMQMLSAAGVEGKQYDVIFNFITSDKADIDYNLEALSQLNSMQSEYNVKVNVTATNIESVGNLIEDIKDMPKKITQKVVTDFVATMPDGESKNTLQNVITNWQALSGGKDTINKELLVDFAIGKYNQAAVDMWYWTIGPGKNIPQQLKHEISAEMRVSWFIGENAGDGDNPPPPPGNDIITNGGTPVESPYKDVLKDLKELRQNAINASGGVQELLKWLGKGKDIRPFRGTLNALVGAGTTEEFQDFVTGLDKVDQNKLFDVSKGVAKLTNAGKALQKAFNEISIGRFVIDQQRAIANSKTQQIAAKKLINAGMDTASAYEAVEDSAFAAAIAAIKLGKDGKKELEKIVKTAKRAEIAIAKAFSPEQALDVLVNDIDSKINSINLDFRINVASDQSAIADAQDDIDKLQYKIDDYQAGLQQIAWQEDEINKKYEEQFEALDRIKQASGQIAQQKKLQLTLADALTQGDIAGAARAAQDLRAKQAEDAIEGQERALSLARESEVAALRDSQGRTRVQLEELVLSLEKQIFEIEEKRIEPAQERVRQAEVLRDLQIANLELQKAEYEDLLDNLKQAQRGTDTYKAKLREALAILQAMAAVELPLATPPPKKEKKGKPADAKASGGMIGYYPMGGMIPYKAGGGIFNSVNSDSVPAMLTPGEYVIKRQMVNKYGTRLFDKLNGGMLPSFGQNRYKFNTPAFNNLPSGLNIDSGASSGNAMATTDNSSVYNSYSVNVNVASATNPNEIARVVMKEIKSMDSQRIRSNNF